MQCYHLQSDNTYQPLTSFNTGQQRRILLGRPTRCLICQDKVKTERKQNRIGCCAYCGNVRVLTDDHVHPKALGGITSKNNIVRVCTWCNSNKGSLTLEQWLHTLPSWAPQWIHVPKYL
jgi:5-methylcytosine-specific restriction endonuclease McrA